MSSPVPGLKSAAPQLLAAAVLLLGAGLCLALNWPGHFSWDSAVQLAEGRRGSYGGSHPPVMSWLLGLADGAWPGAALFLIFDVALVFGALVAFVCVSRPASWLAAPLALAVCWLPQLIVYPAIIWKDVLFAGASIAGFACLTWAAAGWERRRRRVGLLSAGMALLTLAALTRQNGAVVLPFAAVAVGWIALRAGSGPRWRRGAAYGLACLAASAAVALAGSAALNARINTHGVLATQFRDLEVYDLVAAIIQDPKYELGVLKARDPWLEQELRTEGVDNYDPSRIDPMQ
ncbi:MAG TPA: hypothetical protein VHW60_24085, partial [Caulobacteraceae bacterium]|nr:hypothetical protein [Caulobacteraceae bacterium]